MASANFTISNGCINIDEFCGFQLGRKICGREMASLKARNPHITPINMNRKVEYNGPDPSFKSSVMRLWRVATGEAISDDSKHIFAVRLLGKEYILADVRLVQRGDTPGSKVLLEFFFDGELQDLFRADSPDLKPDFFVALEETVNRGVKECYKRRLKSAVENDTTFSEFKSVSLPDTSLEPLRGDLDASFRDAGCMLRFIAVKVYLTMDCAKAVGCVIFPGVFIPGHQDNSKNDPIPRWILGLGATTAVMAVATVYAWAQILLYGNQLSS